MKMPKDLPIVTESISTIRLDRLLYVVDLLATNTRVKEIKELLKEKFGIGSTSQKADIAKAKQMLSERFGRDEELNYNIVLRRYDVLYSDCDMIGDPKDRIAAKRRLTEARAKLTGVEINHKLTVGTINILNYIPDQETINKYEVPPVIEISAVVEPIKVKKPRGRPYRKQHGLLLATDCRQT